MLKRSCANTNTQQRSIRPRRRENVYIERSERRKAPREEAEKGQQEVVAYPTHYVRESPTISYLRERRRTDMYARKMGEIKGVRHPRTPQPISASHSAWQQTSLCRHSSRPLALWVSVASSLSRLFARHYGHTATSFAEHISPSDMWTEAGEPEKKCDITNI